MQISRKLPTERWTSFDDWDYNGMKERLLAALENIDESVLQSMRQRLSAIPVPCVYVYEGPGSQLAVDAGAVHMLLEGFYGTTSPDIQLDVCNSPVCVLFPKSFVSLFSSFALNPIAMPVHIPLRRAVEYLYYFTAVANTAIGELDPSARLGAFVFRDILQKTT
jgi:hypothetical protein